MTPFILGCWNFSSDYWQGLSTASRNNILKEALSLSLLEWDTASRYRNGEALIAQSLFQLRKGGFLSESDFNKIKINSKAPLKKNYSIANDLQKSLSRLKRNALGCYFIHWPLTHYSAAVAVEQLNQCKQQGSIEEVGISNFSLAQIQTAQKGGKIDQLQVACNLLWREPCEEIIPYCQEEKIELQFYSPLAQGLLSNQSPFLTDLPYSDGRASSLCFLQLPLRYQLAPIVKKMKAVASPFSLTEASLLWILQKYPRAKILIGVSSQEQLRQNVSIVKRTKSLSPAQYEALEALSKEAWSAVKRIYPHSTNIFNHTTH